MIATPWDPRFGWDDGANRDDESNEAVLLLNRSAGYAHRRERPVSPLPAKGSGKQVRVRGNHHRRR